MSFKQKPQKIFIDATPLTARRVSGISHLTAELVAALERHPANGSDFELVLISTFDKKKRLKRWGYNSVKYKTLPVPMRVFNLFWNKFNLLPPMDLLIGKGNYLFPNYRNWPLSRKSLSMTFVHDLTYLRFPESMQPKNLAFLSRNMKKWINRADLVLTISDHSRREIIEDLGVLPEKVIRVYPGVNTKEFYPRPQSETASTAKKYGIDGQYLLYLGSLEPRKNLERLIKAYGQLPDELRGSHALCIVGGGGWLNQGILSAIEEAKKSGLNIIKPDIYVEDEDLPALLSGSTLLAHPALYEGFGLSVLQAMACGTPVVTADNSSLPEVAGQAGRLVNAEDVNDISAKIQEVLTDGKLRESMRRKGLEQAAKFSWEEAAQTVADLIKKRSLNQ